MAKTYYAWSPIKGGSSEKPVSIELGAKATASGLGIPDVEFQSMIDAGALREKPYPVPEGYQGSPIDFLREQLAEATSVSDFDAVVAESELGAVESASS